MTDTDNLLAIANQYWSNKEYLKANEIYEELIKRNNPEAFYHLGYAYYRGTGVDKNYEKAKEYLEKSLELGYNRAIVYNVLGCVYLAERQNHTKVTELFKKAYELDPNIDVFMYNLGYSYLKGLGADKDYVKAINLYAKGYNINKDNDFIREIKSLITDENVTKYVFGELAKVEKLEKENEMLKAEVMYQPGGEGYQQAKDEFDRLAKLKD